MHTARTQNLGRLYMLRPQDVSTGSSNEQVFSDGHQMSLAGGFHVWCPEGQGLGRLYSEVPPAKRQTYRYYLPATSLAGGKNLREHLSEEVTTFTSRQWRYRKVIFSVVCVCQSVHWGSIWPLPMMHLASQYRHTKDMFTLVQLGPPCTETPSPGTFNLNLTVREPQSLSPVKGTPVLPPNTHTASYRNTFLFK